jgi:hypothetical protein
MRKAFIIWLGVVIILLATLAMFLYEVYHIIERAHRRNFIAALLQMFPGQQEGLTRNQFNLLMRNPGIKRFEATIGPEAVHAVDEESLEQANDDVCVICIESLRSGRCIQLPSPCQHQYHEHCIEQWLLSKARCPLCNQSMREIL